MESDSLKFTDSRKLFWNHVVPQISTDSPPKLPALPLFTNVTLRLFFPERPLFFQRRVSTPPLRPHRSTSKLPGSASGSPPAAPGSAPASAPGSAPARRPWIRSRAAPLGPLPRGAPGSSTDAAPGSSTDAAPGSPPPAAPGSPPPVGSNQATAARYVILSSALILFFFLLKTDQLIDLLPNI
jgi:hypothetical protein